MAVARTACPVSEFMRTHIPLFFDRFSLSFYREGPCIEYFVSDLLTSETISSALILSFDRRHHDLHVSRFYPEIYLLPNAKYLSAVCFYLLVQHCASVFALDEQYHISLETVQRINDGFYRKLGDFNFVVCKHAVSDVVELVSEIMVTATDTSMIKLRIFQPDEVPFMK